MKSKLIKAVIANQTKIPYICLNENNEYIGWTADFRYKLPNDENMKLDLSIDKDLFLLFVLASAWSRSGYWEDATFFAGYLKYKGMNDYKVWCDKEKSKSLIHKINQDKDEFVKNCTGIKPRKKVSFRKDYYPSVEKIAANWCEIKEKLETSHIENNYMIFINYISELKGLGAGEKRMVIKIPLILRELRCQKIYDNIPGELCCVPDKRVKVSSREIGIKIPHVNSLKSLLKASKIIYDNFGDLYDIPLFAYDDIKEDIG